jgi:leucyl aminopeptidase (aminopeptidase T)
MLTEPSVFSGARQIVQRCVGLEPNQQLVIFVDETTIEPGVVLAEAADALGISQTVFLVPVSVQRRIPAEADLSWLIQKAAREARAILTCVNSSPECLLFRQRIVETHWTAHTRIGHMPGASLEVLGLADVNFDELVASCSCMEIAMARGRKLELISYAPDGTPHSLTADIGGWERLPVASDGVISDGAWGNVPSGETYIAPIEGSAEGSIVINGSMPGLVIEPGGELILSFEWGRLAQVEPHDGASARWLQETQIAKAQAAGDLEWSKLAEIGVGMNPAVRNLTGNMLLDEKAAGTAHVALGTNAFMGGTVYSTIHCDMVTRQPTILIDGKVVVELGELRYSEAAWHDHQAEVALEDSPLISAVWVARSGVQARSSSDGRLQRMLRPEPGRLSACYVGDAQTARFASTLFSLIPPEGHEVPIEELAKQANLDSDLTRRVLHVLQRYELVKVS